MNTAHPHHSVRLASLFKAAGDNLRLDILRALSTDSFGVLELCHIFDIKQSSMSHHLKVLANADLVSTRREGNSIFYRRALMSDDDDLRDAKEAIFQAASALKVSDDKQHAVLEIYQSRARASQDFFNACSKNFKEQQDLIAAFSVYESAVQEALYKAHLPAQNTALEVGPGTGDFLKHLSAYFSAVIALDNSPSMLAQAQALCDAQAFRNVTFVCNDTQYCRDILNTLDFVVINMVLHHTPSPSQIFADVSKSLKTGGLLLICELCQHNQDWVRNACGDLWLGFEPKELNLWAKENRLREGQSDFFALRNGFQIQIRQFFKI